MRSYPWVFGAVGLLLVSLVIVLWARSRPGYDPYGWLVWGKLTLHAKLDTNGAPSWKPLPFLFTVPFALFGRYQLWLWMVFSVAVSLAGPIFAWRIAFRLTGADPARRYAAYVAGLFAAGLMLLMEDTVSHLTYVHYLLSAESDTMIVALVLAAIDFHLAGASPPGVLDLVLCLTRTTRGVAVLRPGRHLAVGQGTRVPALAARLHSALLLFFWFGSPASRRRVSSRLGTSRKIRQGRSTATRSRARSAASTRSRPRLSGSWRC